VFEGAFLFLEKLRLNHKKPKLQGDLENDRNPPGFYAGKYHDLFAERENNLLTIGDAKSPRVRLPYTDT